MEHELGPIHMSSFWGRGFFSGFSPANFFLIKNIVASALKCCLKVEMKVKFSLKLEIPHPRHVIMTLFAIPIFTITYIPECMKYANPIISSEKKTVFNNFLEKTLYFSWKTLGEEKTSKSGNGNVFCDKWCIEK